MTRALYRPGAAIQPAAAEIAEWLGGRLIDGERAPGSLAGLATLDQATGSEISFVTGNRHIKAARASAAGLLITPENFDLPGRARVEVAQVWPAVVGLMTRIFPQPAPAPGIHPSAAIGEDVKLGKDVYVGPFCAIGDGAEIGDETILGPHTSIDPGCRVGAGCRFHSHVTLQGLARVGDRVILHSGVVLGADGFRYESSAAGMLKIPQIGIVLIEDEVEIGANTTIDRAFLHETRIGYGTKIDNQVQIGHNCDVGRFCIIAGCSAISGSVTIEDECIIGGQVSMSEGIRLGRGSMVGGLSGLNKDYPPGSIVAGIPARPHRGYYKLQAYLERLPKLIERVEALEKMVKERDRI